MGPVQVEPRRILCPYGLSQDGKEEETTLVCLYEEDVFDPSDPSSANLASMIAVQVALNYGLFCRTIVFQGSFDENDRRFIRWAAEHTAREIFVKKFLEPNVFLTGGARSLPPIRMRSYLRANLAFKDDPGGPRHSSRQSWSTDRQRFAVMCSGGKDSLLSFGLINEMGYEVHPCFVNESGRHWFTARNAYGFFRDNIPHTSRVWINSDRLFAWMLRHMPFVRNDFFRIRSDEYPIRLWTVAVFLFSILPLIRKRGIGRVLIGNEHDTSRRTHYKGITHYDGLYDQSRYFDHAMTKYFMSKGWSVSLFSILRHLSEMAIQKLLVERYPELQKQQMSCHAAHKEKDRFRPCGRCEKCRRILSMLVAIGGDPTHCGYTERQIGDCLRELPRKGVHQESAGKKHLLHMLLMLGRIEVPDSQRKSTGKHPEILKLRFDPERSPMDDIPVELRSPLYAIFLNHLSGAVQRVGREWKDYYPLGR